MDILKEVLGQVLAYAVALILPVLGVFLGRLILRLIHRIDNDAIRGLAIQAVLFAEDKLGEGTKLGEKKLKLAIDYLVERTKMPRPQAEALVREMYQNIFAPLKKKDKV